MTAVGTPIVIAPALLLIGIVIACRRDRGEYDTDERFSQFILAAFISNALLSAGAAASGAKILGSTSEQLNFISASAAFETLLFFLIACTAACAIACKKLHNVHATQSQAERNSHTEQHQNEGTNTLRF